MASTSTTSTHSQLQEFAPSSSTSAGSNFMASTSSTSMHPQFEESAPSTSTSAGSSMPGTYKPPTTELAFQSDKMYHVFLSFRGKDVRKTLVDHLFQALSEAGLNVFLDSDKLKRGEIIKVSLETAIEGSAIHIPIFSEGYADSAWCLKEAAAMVKSSGSIIPLFYHVTPADVRHPEEKSSPFSRSFLKHYGHSDRHPDRHPGEGIEWWKRGLQQICPCLKFKGRSVRYQREEIDGWKDALEKICSHSGWSMDLTEGFEARLVKTVVNDLLNTLDRVPLQVAKHLVVMDSVNNALIQKLNLNSREEVVKIGIWGIGGIGKTTVATALYNQVSADFDAASFVSTVRTTAAATRGLTKLQKQILKQLIKYDGKVEGVSEGISLFRDRLGGKRVLLVLDDVDADEQLDALVGDWLAPGSRVIITTRNQHILNVAQVPSECIHEMSGLNMDESLQLFRRHAFGRASPSPRYEDLSKNIVEVCKGHPLSLKVIGSFLCDKQDDYWMEALHNLPRNSDMQKIVYSTLKISCGALSDEENEIFLDIACFLIGKDKTLPTVFWKSLYKIADTPLCNLSMKSLIKIDDKGVFDMHDHLQNMGRTIAEKEKPGTRLWEAAHLSTIPNNTNFSRLQLNGGNPQSLEMLYRLPGLCYLHLQNLDIEGMTKDTLAMLPPSLIWLKLEKCSFAIGMNRAVEEPRHSRFVVNLWQLKILELKDCCDLDGLSISSMFSLPNIQLQHLDLSGCDRLIDLPDTIGNLSRLQYLNLKMCLRLKNLPDSIGKLSQLQHLDLEMCSSLENLPVTIGNLSQLQHLNLKMCSELSNLPVIIANLSRLQHLDLEEVLQACESLKKVSRHKMMYHVFLSFRGSDVRKTLVGHLYESLSAAGLNVFLDTDKLNTGEIIGLNLETAIERSVIRIPIFSKGYADSAWCLKEAAAMLSSPGLIIPLFYHVEPSHVRYPLMESSPYKQSFLKHYGHPDRYPREEIDGWKDALHHISSLSGWSMDITQGFEARLVKRVVNDLIRWTERL